MQKILKHNAIALSDKCISIKDTPLRVQNVVRENTVREEVCDEEIDDELAMADTSEGDVSDEPADTEDEDGDEQSFIEIDEENAQDGGNEENDMPIVMNNANDSEKDGEPKLYRFPTLEEKISDEAQELSYKAPTTKQTKQAKPSHTHKSKDYDELIEKSVSEASRILESAHSKAQEEYIQMMAKGQEELDRQVQSAREAGYAEAMRTQIENVQGTIERLETAVADIEGRQEAYLATCEQDIKWLAVEIASKIMRTSLETNELGLAPLVKAAVASQRTAKWMTIEISSATGELLELLHEQLEQSDPDRIRIKAAANAPEGTCLIQMPEGFVDASIYTQIDNLKQYFTIAD